MRKCEVKMKIIVNHSSMQPIYEQIVEQVKHQIVQEELRGGEALPSVRVLAKELKISALTVKKAYDALEQEGLVVTVHGKGSFIASTNRSLIEEEGRRETEMYMENAVQKGRSCGMSDGELLELLRLVMEDHT